MAVIPEMQGYFNSSKSMNVIHLSTKIKKKNDHFNRYKIGLLLFFMYIWIYVSSLKKEKKGKENRK